MGETLYGLGGVLEGIPLTSAADRDACGAVVVGNTLEYLVDIHKVKINEALDLLVTKDLGRHEPEDALEDPVSLRFRNLLESQLSL